jgi:lipopolysaccharide/colanic/teichoic acid biosynthesis glycosyltransferase
MVVLFVPLLIISLIIVIDSPGASPLYVQERVGKDGRKFRFYKLRSMIPGAEQQLDDLLDRNEMEGPAFKMKNDPRITRFGRFIRRTSIDELPQLLNILKGDMSFVGPRPDVPGYADKLEGDDRDLLKLRPGITGPATLKYRVEDEMIAKFVSEIKAGQNEQVSKFESAPDFSRMSDQEIAVWYNDNVIYPDKVRLNCYYYRNYSFWKDIQMIMCTVLGKKMKYAGEEI